MAYRFKLDEPTAREICRIGVEQIDQVLQELGRNEGRHQAVHQARKGLKRIRSLLRLSRNAIGGKAFKAENRGFRDIARSLSGARDKQAMIESVTKLQVRFGPDWNVPAVAGLKSWLYEERRQAEKSLANGTRRSALSALTEAREAFANLTPKDDRGALMAGLEDCYRRGRRSFTKAFSSGVDEDFHEWRKWTQQHWRHMQLLMLVWPDIMTARLEAARELSQVLGDDHDLYILIGLVKQNGSELADDRSIEEFLEACHVRQRELRVFAEPRGARLFAEPAKRFRDRVSAYWVAASAMEKPASPTAGEALDSEPLLSTQGLFGG